MPERLRRDEIGPLYIALMEQIVTRLDSIRESTLEATSHPEHSSNWKNAEFCYLQIRRICEYAAIAVLVAHGEHAEFFTQTLLKEWNAGKLFQRLTTLNSNAFPLPVITHINFKGEGQHHLEPQERLLNADDVSRIYNACGDRLHASSLKRILAGKLPEYTFDDIAEWSNKIVKTLENHLILLPEISSVMLVVLKDNEDGKVHCSFADANGPAMLAENGSPAEFAVIEKI